MARAPVGRHIPYAAREMYYPGWAPDFTGLDDLEIKDAEGEPFILGEPDGEGNPVPVTLKDVAPERRWAIDFDTGQLMGQRDFQDLFEAWIQFKCTKKGEIVAITETNKYFDPRLEPVPSVQEFVLRQPDGTQATWKKLRVQDFKPPSTIANESLVAQLVEGLGGALSGFVQKGQPLQESTLGKPAEVRPKFTTVPPPSDGE